MPTILPEGDVLDRWVENPYWQHFCGEVIFQHRLPMDETTMMRFRHRIGEDGARELLKMSIALGQDTGVIVIGKRSFHDVVDLLHVTQRP